MHRACCLALAVVACKKPPSAVSLEIAILSKTPDLTGATLVFAGRELGAVGKDYTYVKVPATTRSLDGFALRVPTPCGPADLPLAVGIGGRRELDPDHVETSSVYVALDDRSEGGGGLGYDNRGGPAATLRFGKLELAIPADHKGVLPLWSAACETPHVSLNDRALDVSRDLLLPGDPCGAAPVSAVVSLRGRRCYVVRAVPYEWDIGPQYPNDAAPPTTTRLPDHEVYLVPRFDYFLEPAPNTVRTDSTHSCLRDVLDCDGVTP